MRERYIKIYFFLFVIGITLILLDVIVGKGKMFLFFFIPVFYSGGILSIIGFLCIIFSMLLVFYSFFVSAEIESPIQEKVKIDKSAGGIIFIGPIPILFGTEKNIVKIMVIVCIVMMILLIFLVSFFMFYFKP